MTDLTDQRLAAQYEAYPYPHRDPRDEAKRMIVGSPGAGDQTAAYGAPGTLVATVTGGVGVSGTVTFSEGVTTLGQADVAGDI